MRKRALHHGSSIPRGCGICRPEGLKSTCMRWRSETPQGRFPHHHLSVTLPISLSPPRSRYLGTCPGKCKMVLSYFARRRKGGNDVNTYFELSLSVGDTALVFASNQTKHRASLWLPLCLSQGLRVSLKAPTFIFLLNLQGISVTVTRIFFFPLSFRANTHACIFLKANIKNGGQRQFGRST